MASKIDLISNAYLRLGEQSINSLTDGTTRANIAAGLYDSVIDGLLTSNRWRFAHQRLQLSQLVTAPAHTYSYAYQLPADFLMAVSIYPHSDRYEIIGDQLHSNLSEVTLDYIERPDESKFPPYFLEVAEIALAKAFCLPVTENNTRLENLTNEYKLALNRAMWADAQGRPPTAPLNNPVIAARF